MIENRECLLTADSDINISVAKRTKADCTKAEWPYPLNGDFVRFLIDIFTSYLDSKRFESNITIRKRD